MNENTIGPIQTLPDPPDLPEQTITLSEGNFTVNPGPQITVEELLARLAAIEARISALEGV